MPTIKENIAKFLGIEVPDDKSGTGGGGGGNNAPTGEQIAQAASQATLQELKEQGLLRDKPVTTTEQSPNPTDDNITWDNLDVTTEAGKKAYETWLASDEAKKPVSLNS